MTGNNNNNLNGLATVVGFFVGESCNVPDTIIGRRAVVDTTRTDLTDYVNDIAVMCYDLNCHYRYLIIGCNTANTGYPKRFSYIAI